MPVFVEVSENPVINCLSRFYCVRNTVIYSEYVIGDNTRNNKRQGTQQRVAGKRNNAPFPAVLASHQLVVISWRSSVGGHQLVVNIDGHRSSWSSACHVLPIINYKQVNDYLVFSVYSLGLFSPFFHSILALVPVTWWIWCEHQYIW